MQMNTSLPQRILILLLILCGAVMVSRADNTTATEITIPTADGAYISFNNAKYSGTTLESDGNIAGSTGSSTSIEFSIKNETQQDYVLSFLTGAQNLTAQLGITMTNAEGKSVLSSTAEVENLGSWTPSTPHAYLLSNLPAGTYTLSIKVSSTTGSYAGNYGYLSIRKASDCTADFSKSIITGGGSYNSSKSYLESTKATTVINNVFYVSEADDYDLSFLSGAKGCSAQWGVSLTHADGTSALNTTGTTSDISNWTPSSLHDYAVSLKAGVYMMTLKMNSITTGKYAGNYSSLSLAKVSSYQQATSIFNLNSENNQYVSYNGVKYESKNDNVGYVKTNTSASYTFYNVVAGTYNLVMGLAKQKGTGTMTITIKDADGSNEIAKTYAIDSNTPADYTATTVADGISLTQGLKQMTLAFSSDGTDYLVNYKNMKFEATSVSVTLGASGYATFSSTSALDFSGVSDLEAYVATAVDNNTVTLEKKTEAPAGTGLLLKGASNTTYTIPAASATPAALSCNYLVATTSTTTVSKADNGTNYIFGSKADGSEAGFYSVGSTPATLTGGKAYLSLASTSTAKHLTIGFGHTTGIGSVEREGYTINTRNTYNLSGQRVSSCYKGIIIKNGKKIIQK